MALDALLVAFEKNFLIVNARLAHGMLKSVIGDRASTERRRGEEKETLARLWTAPCHKQWVGSQSKWAKNKPGQAEVPMVKLRQSISACYSATGQPRRPTGTAMQTSAAYEWHNERRARSNASALTHLRKRPSIARPTPRLHAPTASRELGRTDCSIALRLTTHASLASSATVLKP